MVFPEQDAVITITSESIDTAKTMQMVWDILVPAMKETPQPENSKDNTQLKNRLQSLKYTPPQFSATSDTASRISGKQYLFDKNDFNAKSVFFRFEDDKCILTLKEEGKPDVVITHGMNFWIREGNYKPRAHSLFSLRRIDFDSIVAASATWQNENTLILTWRHIETVHGDTLTCIFDNDKLTIKFLFSIARLRNEPDERQDLTGKWV